MKTCIDCQVEKPLYEFGKRLDRPSLRPRCKSCTNQRRAEWLAANPKAVAAYSEKRKSKKYSYPSKLAPEVSRRNSAEYYRKNREKLAERYRRNAARWLANNPDKSAAKKAARRARKALAQPKWANTFFISEAYHLARLRTKLTGIPWEVDHIVPLKSSLVCGLHVEANLAVITARDNSSKGNRFWPDMP